jgi:uncharacterized protein DUF4189
MTRWWRPISAVVALFAASLTQEQAAQRTVYGAIAYNPKTVAYGDDHGEASAASAEQKALSFCARRGDGCKLVASFSNACGAVAVLGATGATFTATNAKRAAAETQATRDCHQQPNNTSCRILDSICAQP